MFYNTRKINLIAGLACLALFGFSLFLQFYAKLPPCPLCIMQRLIVLSLGIIYLMAAIPKQRLWQIVMNTLCLVTTLLGASVSARHVYLQSLSPEQLPGCGPGLNFMLKYFNWLDTLKAMLTGSGECAQVHWTFLSFSIPQWTFLWFAVFSLISLWNLLAIKSKSI